MSVAPPRSPVRRGPLHAVHEAHGARWIAPGVLWPSAYADPAAERAAAVAAAVVVDRGPLDKYSVRSRSLAPALAAAGLASAAGRLVGATTAGRAVDVWGIAPDEALVIGAAPLGPPAVSDAVVTDLSSGLGALALVGPRSRAVLEELTPLDMGARSFADGAVASAPLAGVRAIVGRQDRAGLLGFTILVDRDLAEYVWEALLRSGDRHGLVAAGADALGPA